MSSRISFILLFVSVLSFGQMNVMVLSSPTVDLFVGTEYVKSSFTEASGAYPRANSIADWQAYLNTGGLTYSVKESTTLDSCIIVVNDGGYTDTVAVAHIADEGEGETSYAYEVYGDMRINGSDDTDDTLTVANFTYYLQLGSNWDWVNSMGGKLPGLGGVDTNGDHVATGGVYKCCADCSDPDNLPCYCSGWRGVTGYWSFADIGLYAYLRQQTLSCTSATYALSFYKDGIHSDGNLTWELGKWYKITQRYVLNTIGQYDGVYEFFRNDTCYISNTGMKYRDYSTTRIDDWWVSVFAGGEVLAGFSGMDCYLDDFVVWTDNAQGRTPYGYETVMTNVPTMATPNTSE